MRKKIMNKSLKTFLILALAALLSLQNAFAQKVITGTGDLPLELNLLIDHIQFGNPQNFTRDLSIVTKIDAYARSMTKEDIFLLGKVEIYKTLLKNYSVPDKTPLSGTSVEIIEAGLKRTYDNFLKWFLLALLKDTTDLINNPIYKEYLLQKDTNVKTDKIEYRKVAKKAELLQYWINHINPNSENFPVDLKGTLAPKLIEALLNIKNSYYLMATEVSQTPIFEPVKNPEELKFFKVVDRKKIAPVKPAPGEGSKSVEEILAPITEKPTELPKPSQENWLNEENTPPSLQNLPKAKNDADWLQDF
jgi:hypothetical protein